MGSLSVKSAKLQILNYAFDTLYIRMFRYEFYNNM